MTISADYKQSPDGHRYLSVFLSGEVTFMKSGSTRHEV